MVDAVQIEDLRRLLTLADHQRLTDAAAALRMSQPTLSRLLARVEDELGARLFERDARGLLSQEPALSGCPRARRRLRVMGAALVVVFGEPSGAAKGMAAPWR